MPTDFDGLLANQALLSRCAIPPRFDRELLGALGADDGGEFSALLANGIVVVERDQPPLYRLREDVRDAVLARLCAESPADELRLRALAFEYFLRRLEHAEPEQHAEDEASCFYHLAELMELLTVRREWQRIAAYVAAVRAAGPQHPAHLHRLSFYEGLVAVRTQDYDHGYALMAALFDQPDMEDDIRVRALNALGAAHWYQSRYDRALAAYQEVDRLARQIGDRLYQSIALLNMSMIYNELGNYNRALEASVESLRIFRALHNTYREAHALSEVGNNAMQLGRWPMAYEHFQQAITLYQALGATACLANLYWNQGLLHHLLGASSASEAAYRQGLAISQSQEHGDQAISMDLLTYLGFLFQTQRRYGEAQGAYDQAITLAGQLRNRHSLALIEYRRGQILQHQGRVDEALAAYGAAAEAIESLRGAIEGEDIKIGLLGTAQQVYESLVLLCDEHDRHADAFNYVERARSRAFLDTLAKKAPELYDTLDQPIATLHEVQARLPEDALLIEYFTTGVLPQGEHLLNNLPPQNARLRGHMALPPSILIFAVTRDHVEVHRARLDPNKLRPLASDHSPGRHLLRERMLPLLYAELIGPVAHLLRGRRLLFLIPHGPLHYVPFLALRSAAGDFLLNQDGPAITRAPSATILLRNCLDRPRSQADGFLALGYNDRSTRELRHAEDEARAIARLMNGQAWTGPDSKSQRFFAAARQVRWLHIAGHAIYDPRDPLESYLRLGDEDTLSARAIMGGLDLHADLVTLSACTSGVTHVVPGDELFGLQRALLYAGAPAVVCTLWEVADVVALLVMEQFYLGLRQGRPAAEALRNAQVAVRTMTGRDLAAIIEGWRAERGLIAVLDDLPSIAPELYDTCPFADPFHWAPFMLIGRPD